jgi:uncharacterized membrane protein
LALIGRTALDDADLASMVAMGTGAQFYEYAMIRVQIPTALAILFVNTLIMNFFVFR